MKIANIKAGQNPGTAFTVGHHWITASHVLGRRFHKKLWIDGELCDVRRIWVPPGDAAMIELAEPPRLGRAFDASGVDPHTASDIYTIVYVHSSQSPRYTETDRNPFVLVRSGPFFNGESGSPVMRGDRVVGVLTSRSGAYFSFLTPTGDPKWYPFGDPTLDGKWTIADWRECLRMSGGSIFAFWRILDRFNYEARGSGLWTNWIPLKGSEPMEDE